MCGGPFTQRTAEEVAAEEWRKYQEEWPEYKRADSEERKAAGGAGGTSGSDRSAPWPREGKLAAAAVEKTASKGAQSRLKGQKSAEGEELQAAAWVKGGAQGRRAAVEGPSGEVQHGSGRARQRSARGARRGGHQG